MLYKLNKIKEKQKMSIYAEENCCKVCTIWDCPEPCDLWELEVLEKEAKERDEENTIDLNCSCGAYLGQKNVVTKIVKIDETIPYLVENTELKVPNIVCRCPNCKVINHIRGLV